MIIGIISSKDSLALICGAVFSFARRFLLLRVLQEKSSMKEMTFEEVVKRVVPSSSKRRKRSLSIA